MTGSATNHFLWASSATAVRSGPARRRIGPEAGHALEKLGHAVEYLTDEFFNDGSASSASRRDRFEAIELLMCLNRRIYLDCPEIPSLRDRLSAFLHRIL